MRSLFPAAAAVLVAALGATLAHAQDAELAVRLADAQNQLVLNESGRATALQTTAETVVEPRLHAVPGSAARSVTWTQVDERGVRTPWYAVDFDGTGFHEARATDYVLRLRYTEFDPQVGEPDVPEALSSAADSQIWIVQYWTQGMEAYRQALRDEGAVIHLFLANHAQVVEMTAAEMAAVSELPFVRWVGRYHPAYRLEEGLLDSNPGWITSDALRVNMLTMERGMQGQAPVAEHIASIGGVVESYSAETYLMSATLTRAQLVEVASLDGVQWIDAWGEPEDDMNVARDLHGANYVETMGGYTGVGVRGEVFDSGCASNHPDLQSFLMHGPVGSGSHGTCTSGINFGTGGGNFSARGMAPDGFLVMAQYTQGFQGGSRYAHTAQLQNATYECVYQSNSWGDPRTTQYTAVSQDMDMILFDHSRISIFQSQSNAGNQMSRPQAWAKNIVAGGGIMHENTLTMADDNWSFGASIGPAQDGRIKPDLASFYDSILATDVPGGGGYASGNYYSSFGGTSGATPIIAGSMGLFYEMWHDGIFGNPTGTSVFDSRPFNTTAKAALINTATQWTFSGASSDLTRTHQGWGHPDLQRLYDLRDRTFHINESEVLAEGQAIAYSLVVPPGEPAIKATMVYRDNPGTTSSSQHRINDVTLKVTSPGGTVYWGNNGLLAGNWSTAGGAANTKDTVECVFVQNPTNGPWLVEVIASDVNQDAHVETPATDVDFALWVTGVDPSGSFLGLNYCGPANPNSTGLPARITAMGTKVVIDNDLTLMAMDMPPNQFGYFLASQTQDFVQFPGGSFGNLCLGGTIARFAGNVQNTGAGGAFQLVVDLTQMPTSPVSAVMPGETWNFQAWFRDFQFVQTSNFTDGYSILFE